MNIMIDPPFTMINPPFTMINPPFTNTDCKRETPVKELCCVLGDLDFTKTRVPTAIMDKHNYHKRLISWELGGIPVR